MKTLKDFLIKKQAYKEDFDFAKDLTLEQFLNTCQRGDCILWLFAKLNPDSLRELTLAKGHCANTVRHLMEDERSTKAVDVAIAFGEGKATRKELDDAAYAARVVYVAAAADAGHAAYAAAYARAAYDAARAAYYAARAAYAAAAAEDAAADVAAYARAAYDAARAAYDAARAAYAAAAAEDAAADVAAAYADADAARAAARKQNQKQTANICRKYLPLEIWNQNLI